VTQRGTVEVLVGRVPGQAEKLLVQSSCVLQFSRQEQRRPVVDAVLPQLFHLGAGSQTRNVQRFLTPGGIEVRQEAAERAETAIERFRSTFI